MHAADEDDLAPGLGVAEAEHRLQRAGGGGEDGEEKADAGHASLSPGAPGETFAPEYEAIRGQLRAALPFLILPRETVDAFLAALSQAKRKPRKPEHATRLFLLSTDFFAHGADESRPLGYSQLYDPYRSPCYNPMEPA